MYFLQCKTLPVHCSSVLYEKITRKILNCSRAHHGDEASNEAEVCEVVRVDGGGRVDLQAVVVLAGILKQTVHGVQDLMGEQKEPLPADRHNKSCYASFKSLREVPRGCKVKASEVSHLYQANLQQTSF